MSSSPQHPPQDQAEMSTTGGADPFSLAAARARDAADALAPLRAKFTLAEDVIYLDGNSLGALPAGVAGRLAHAITAEWGEGLIRSWNDAGWIDLPRRVGGKIAALIGAEENSVIAADSTSVNLFKTLSAALTLNRGRRRIITEAANFPTDNYIAEGVIRQMGQGHELVACPDPDAIIPALDDDTAVMMLTHVNYRNGRRHDLQKLTAAAHEAGALVIWDLAHSAGAMDIDLASARADFAVGCGYKYLNGGPGAPAYLYVAPRHHHHSRQPLTGWFAHQAPFDFAPGFTPAGDITQYLCGTPGVLSMQALDHALELWEGVDLSAVGRKSLALTGYFIDLVETRCAGHGLTLITPREDAVRGAQVSFTHPEGGYAMIQALIDAGVIGDFRAPDILRFGFAPLYTRFVDVWQAVDRFSDILASRRWDNPRFHRRKPVT